PHMIANARLPTGIAHLLEQRRRRRIVADVVERLDLRMPLHVRLAREDENLERFRGRRGNGEKRQERKCKSHAWQVSGWDGGLHHRRFRSMASAAFLASEESITCADVCWMKSTVSPKGIAYPCPSSLGSSFLSFSKT